MREEILEIINQGKKSLTIQEILDKLVEKQIMNNNSVENLQILANELKEMEKSAQVQQTREQKYKIFNDKFLRSGKLVVNKRGFGFLLLDNEDDIKIDAVNMNEARHNDYVLVELLPNHEGRVIRVLDREAGQLVGEYYIKDGAGHIKLDDQRYKIDIEIDLTESKGAVDGHKVLVKIKEELGHNRCKGEVLRVIGYKDDPGVDILSIVYEHNIPTEFSSEVEEQVEKIPYEVPEEVSSKRRDLRNETIFTIDGDDAKDFDDAVSIKKLDNGNYLLSVHIADVSYYVTEDSPLDKEAYDRGTSVYLIDRVIPMLPQKLSNGICSLVEGNDRLTLTCDMEINPNGKVVNHEIYESVIRSKKRMTYNKANEILEKDETPEGYEPFADTLKEMQLLADILRNSKDRRGYINFDTDELKVIVDEKCKPTDVKLRERGKAENLIEDFMIIANETVASHLFWMSLPSVYRIHEAPNEKKIDEFIKFVNILGYKIVRKGKETTPKSVQNMLDVLKDKEEFPILSSLLLRSMKKAVYSPDNKGHFGLASECYTHFTSPIRRYPDTTIHRLIRTYLVENKMDAETLSYWETKLASLCEHTSATEQEAVECERDVDKMKTAEYMEQHIGEEYEGIISSVMSFGMFIRLNNLIEGHVKISEMKDDYYEFDPLKMCYIGKRNKRIYTLGDKVVIKVARASKVDSTIDFEIVKILTKKKKINKF
ncbi:MAG: ribonuclease R [Bacilli bacterium]|nr:ribonuclease R [Bacilli bacterium]